MKDQGNAVPDYALLFTNQAEKYEQLVSYEDYTNNLLETIKSIISLSDNIKIADVGSGTGRITFLLSPFVHKVYGIEPNDSMRKVATLKCEEKGITNIEFKSGGYESIPLESHSVDLVVEGWSLLYYYKLSLPDWENTINNAIAEMNRILKPKGKMIIIETLGTMEESPFMNEFQTPLYNFLEQKHNFTRKSIRTDYKFESIVQAIELITFFFGEEMGKAIKERNSHIVPECTGVWYK